MASAIFIILASYFFIGNSALIAKVWANGEEFNKLAEDKKWTEMNIIFRYSLLWLPFVPVLLFNDSLPASWKKETNNYEIGEVVTTLLLLTVGWCVLPVLTVTSFAIWIASKKDFLFGKD